MRPHVRITRYPYEEPHHVNLVLQVCNGRSLAQLEFYMAARSLVAWADHLEVFPRHNQDVFLFEIGSSDRRTVGRTTLGSGRSSRMPQVIARSIFDSTITRRCRIEKFPSFASRRKHRRSTIWGGFAASSGISSTPCWTGGFGTARCMSLSMTPQATPHLRPVECPSPHASPPPYRSRRR